MSELSFNTNLALVAKQYGLTFQWQQLKFGYERAMFKLDTATDFYAAEELIRKKVKNAVIETWTCFDGEFEGIVYVMEKAKSEELAEKQAEEWNAVEDWWQRYHAADEETKRMMRCGALA